jgi:hypothetical protein
VPPVPSIRPVSSTLSRPECPPDNRRPVAPTIPPASRSRGRARRGSCPSRQCRSAPRGLCGSPPRFRRPCATRCR